MEDADPARTNQQPDDDEDDAPQDLPAEEREHTGDHEYHCDNPENQVHAFEVPGAFQMETCAQLGPCGGPRWKTL